MTLPCEEQYLEFLRKLPELPPHLRWDITHSVTENGDIYRIKWTATAKPILAFAEDSDYD